MTNCEAKLTRFAGQMIGNLNCKHTQRKGGVCAQGAEHYLCKDDTIFLLTDGKF